MPVSTDIEYLDGEFTVSETEPSTISELSELIGEQAVIDEAVSNLRYRNKYPRVYRKVSDAILAEFAKPQKIGKDGQPVTKVVKGKDGEPETSSPVLVDPIAHLRAFLATGDEAKAKLAELFASIGSSEPLYVKGERSAGGGGKIAEWAVKAANDKFAVEDAAPGTVERVASVIEAEVPGYKVARDSEGNVTPDSLARAIAAFKKHEDAKAKAAVLGKLG